MLGLRESQARSSQSKGLVRLFSQIPTYLLKPYSEIPSSRKPSLIFQKQLPLSKASPSTFGHFGDYSYNNFVTCPYSSFLTTSLQCETWEWGAGSTPRSYQCRQ